LIALNNLAWLRLQAGQNQAGMELAQRAYAINPRVPSIADTYGWALVQTGNAKQAVSILRAAYNAAPRDNEMRFHLAVALLKTGAKEEARQHLQAIVDAQQTGPEAEQARSLLSGSDAMASR
jgi:cellulose synthase operon protein C